MLTRKKKNNLKNKSFIWRDLFVESRDNMAQYLRIKTVFLIAL
jgi:hypothetical protein